MGKKDAVALRNTTAPFTAPTGGLSDEQFQHMLGEMRGWFAPAWEQKDYGFAIVVLSHGFVYAGDVSVVGEEVIIGRPLNIRHWGTTKGLGQLAVEGPQKDTQLDRCGTIHAPLLALIQIMNVIDSVKPKWEQHQMLKGHTGK